MPGSTQVQSSPKDQFPRGPTNLHDHHAHEHDHRHHEGVSAPANAHYIHKEALRLALGSILNPKRPYTPSSRSSSGTASPAYPYSFPQTSAPGTPSIPPPPQNTPTHGRSDSHLIPFPHHPHPPPLQHSHSHSHAHVPSPLSLLDTHEQGTSNTLLNSQANSPTHSASLSHAASQCPSPQMETQRALPDMNTSAPTPQDAILSPSPVPGTLVTSESAAASDKAKITYIQALQSKNRWDALIHGSFS